MLEGMLISAHWNFNPQEYKRLIPVSILIHIAMPWLTKGHKHRILSLVIPVSLVFSVYVFSKAVTQYFSICIRISRGKNQCMVYEQVRFFHPIPQSPFIHFFYCKYLLLKQLLMRDDPPSGNNTGRVEQTLFYVILSTEHLFKHLGSGNLCCLICSRMNISLCDEQKP